MTDKTCVSCGTPVREWPMVFRGDDTCSVNCAKVAAAQTEPEKTLTKKELKKTKKKAAVQMGADE